MSSDEINELFWLQYGDAIRREVGVGSDDNLFFLASEAQRGPLAGNNIPDRYTHQGLYNIGNNLLSTNNVFFNPSSTHGYDQALGSFLDWVDLGDKSNPALDAAYLDALLDQPACQISLEKQKKIASEDYKVAKELGLTDLQFHHYVATGKTPALQAAQQDVDAIRARIQQIQIEKGGPMGPAVKQDRYRLGMGIVQDEDKLGYNMRGAFGNVLTAAELTRAYQSGENVPAPDYAYIPLYQAPDYTQFVQDAMSNAASGDYNPSYSIDVNIDTSMSTSDYDFGQTDGGANSTVNVGGWFSFSAAGSQPDEFSVLETESESSDVSIKITYDDIKAINIYLGPWGIDVTKYNLRSDAPEEVKTLAKVTQMIVVSGLGYEITVGDSTASTLDSKLQEAMNDGGVVSVFGIPVSLDGSDSTDEEDKTHKASWDEDSRTFTVTPNLDNNCVTVVGVVGERVT
ncbi:hypothetical protein FZEAL_8777 [Fusarium zealandicum]|uniref:Uncharacterized protein n=1 Tax=Fusarium zealandicum TaxID=1053134 RepID=A0A8H4UDS2_9HYPO|nr:hypothetical protein FZEAL_8777 [Fusarium zealandicum]